MLLTSICFASPQATCIVDPRFREQFQISRATPAYMDLLQAVPKIFVGSPMRLKVGSARH